MTDLFLRAKHWQIFSLGFGMPFLLLIGIILFVFLTTLDGGNPSAIEAITFLIVYAFSTLLSVFILFGWLWAIATGLDEKIPPHLKLNLKRFKFIFAIPIVYILIVLTSLIVIAVALPLANVFVSPSILIVILPIHLMAMACIFYCLYYSAKTIKTATSQREVSFTDFIGEFALLWVFPAGVWIIQPIINELYLDKKNS